MSGRSIAALWNSLIAGLLAVCFFAGLGAIGLVGPDEPRYGSVASAMARTGDWVTPRLWGHPWFDKPVLSYWFAGVLFRLFGVADWLARVPGAFAALAGALLLGWAMKRRYGAGAARLALVFFPAAIGLLAFAHAATPDILLAVALEAAMLAALAALTWSGADTEGRARGSRRYLVLVGAFIGLGTLAKGPVAIILAGGSVLLWAVLTRRWRNALQFLRWEPAAAFAIVAVPWYAACSFANPDFAAAFLWRQNVERFVTPVFEHLQPWWFFFPILALGLFPWTPLLLAAARDAWRVLRTRRAAQSPAAFAACWAVFPLLFFSFSDSKLPGYILPAIPPLLFVLARSADRAASAHRPGDRDRASAWAVVLVGAGWIALAAAAGHWLGRLPRLWVVMHRPAIDGYLIATALAGILIAVLGLVSRLRLALAVSALWMGLLAGATSWCFLPQVSPYLSSREAAFAAQALTQPSAAIDVYGLSRDRAYGLSFYFERELPEWSPGEPAPTWLITTPGALSTLPRFPARITTVHPLPGGLALVRISPTAAPRTP